MPLEIQRNVSETHPVLGIHASHLTVQYNEEMVEMPYFAASYADYDKSYKCRMNLASNIFQYHVDLNRYPLSIHRLDTVEENYRSILRRSAPIIADLNFSWADHVWNEEERNMILDLQLRLDTSFLSDVVNRNLDIETFRDRLDSLDSYHEDITKCPTISLYTELEILEQQLDLIIKRGYQRFNIEWADIGTHDDRWELLGKIREKKIWCNLVGVMQRWYGEERLSYPMLAFIRGCHTCGMGYRFGSSRKSDRPYRIWALSGRTYSFEETNSTHNVANTNSHNLLLERIVDAHRYIDQHRFFRDFLPQTFHL